MTRALITPRQRELLVLLQDGHSNKEIAHRLGIATDTVKVSASLLYARIAVGNRVQAADWAWRNPDYLREPARDVYQYPIGV